MIYVAPAREPATLPAIVTVVGPPKILFPIVVVVEAVAVAKF
jgi:hypothetical protein